MTVSARQGGRGCVRGSWWFIRVGHCIYGIEWYGEEVVFRAEKVVMETFLVLVKI